MNEVDSERNDVTPRTARKVHVLQLLSWAPVVAQLSELCLRALKRLSLAYRDALADHSADPCFFVPGLSIGSASQTLGSPSIWNRYLQCSRNAYVYI